ncbi:MAG: tol-pal system protein YbgF [Gammaproteobacteria bacterium]|nr:tol-pal system protein YbgF [Gammaproteobacteria bacterium]
MRSSILALSVGALLAGCTTITPTDDPVYLRIQDLEARLMRVERVVNNESLIELAGQIEQLRADVSALRGEVETLRFETESAGERQRQLYLDIDQRLQALEQSRGASADPRFGADTAGPDGGFGGFSAGGAGGSSTAPASGAQASAGNDQEQYSQAFQLLQARRYDAAADAFRQFVEAYPSSDLADNAQYWLAETLYVRQQFDAALREFQKVIDVYPRSDKLADSLLKIGYCNYELKRWNDARAALERVMREFPGTTAAQLAATRLERLEQEAG